ncbi:hypothetical protein, partial [Nostoc sp.]|uniref:hypothetical protein n=1 Tax=Nostoc sp. TaxID=1180 RepID=UPI002FF457B8
LGVALRKNSSMPGFLIHTIQKAPRSTVWGFLLWLSNKKTMQLITYSSDCALFPASLYKNRACSVWADKESILSLNGKTYTCI